MSSIVDPIHVSTISGKQVRFYRAPAGAHEVPWHASEDLKLAMGLSRKTRRLLAHGSRIMLGGETGVVASENAIVAIASHAVALGFIDAAIHCGYATQTFLAEYQDAAAAALKAALPDADINQLGEAILNSLGAPV